TVSQPEVKPFADARLANDPHPTIGYRSGLTSYEESLIHGQFVGRAWNGAGFLNAWDDVRLDPAKVATPESFWLEIDGQALISHWEWAGYEQRQEERGPHVMTTLRHTVRPVTVVVHMLLDGTPVFTRWLEITNTGAQVAALNAVAPWSGALPAVPRWRAHLPDRKAPLYSIGYMVGSHWGDEGNFQWQPLPHARFAIDGRYRHGRHRHPMFVLRNNATGEFMVGQLAWSGGYTFEFDLNADPGGGDEAARLSFKLGPEAPAPQRTLAASETVRTPEVHLGLTFGDLDTAIQAMHTHIRRSVILPQPRGMGGWIQAGIGPEIEITQASVYHAIENAAQFGAEVFFIDASWYGAPLSNWWETCGDWNVSLERFPGGLAAIRDRVHAKGMLFGLWMDAERIGKQSRVAQEHPEWWAVAYNGQKEPLGGLLDLTRPAAAQWMEEQIARVIEENDLEFFRLDYNTGDLVPGFQSLRNGYVENGYWRYYEAQYAVYERLRRRFPHVILENCAGGGGRTDLGLVRYFSHTWVTDWQIAPRSFTITNGMTMALPPETVDRLVGGQNGHTTADLDAQLRQLVFVSFNLSFLSPLDTAMNPLLLERVNHMVDLYKRIVRPMRPHSRMYHHTPAFDGPEPQGWGVLELASEDHTQALAAVFQLASPCGDEYLLRLRGLDVGKRYRVTFDNSGQTCEVDGWVLMKQGLTVRLEGALTSELLVCEAL
ncbi:MAG: hypothetical protein GX557_08655, partial [Chloroflexi bacterium]|nr:hypothetical protein [Chloroflexota bacterium]